MLAVNKGQGNYNLLIPKIAGTWTLSGPAVLSIVERLSSFRGDFLYSVHTRVLGLSFVGRFVLFQSVLYQRFHCKSFGKEYL